MKTARKKEREKVSPNPFGFFAYPRSMNYINKEGALLLIGLECRYDVELA
jgi:hypothetical protein